MQPETDRSAARALLAFWRSAGVDMEEAEAVYAAAPAVARSPVTPAAKPGVAPRPQAPRPARRGAAPAATDEDARRLAAAAGSVSALRTAIEDFQGCALRATARNTVFADGVDAAPVLILGEAPDKEDDQLGKPFAGRAGRMLDRMLAQIGLDKRTNVLISNTIFWRPPGDRDPTPGEVLACLPFVERLITLVQPKLLILLGKAAPLLLKRDETLLKLRGRRLSYERDGLSINAMVMLHPAYLLRQPLQKRLAWSDLLTTESWLDDLGVARTPLP
jgi:uracil-DNA glycosylase